MSKLYIFNQNVIALDRSQNIYLLYRALSNWMYRHKWAYCASTLNRKIWREGKEIRSSAYLLQYT